MRGKTSIGQTVSWKTMQVNIFAKAAGDEREKSGILQGTFKTSARASGRFGRV
jgi:hypothetical protein